MIKALKIDRWLGDIPNCDYLRKIFIKCGKIAFTALKKILIIHKWENRMTANKNENMCLKPHPNCLNASNYKKSGV